MRQDGRTFFWLVGRTNVTSFWMEGRAVSMCFPPSHQKQEASGQVRGEPALRGALIWISLGEIFNFTEIDNHSSYCLIMKNTCSCKGGWKTKFHLRNCVLCTSCYKAEAVYMQKNTSEIQSCRQRPGNEELHVVPDQKFILSGFKYADPSASLPSFICPVNAVILVQAHQVLWSIK